MRREGRLFTEGYRKMKLKAASGIMLTLLFIGVLMLAFSIQRTEGMEPPETEWARPYGGGGNDYAFSVVETSDGGYVLAGRTNSFGAGGDDFWLVRIAPPKPVGGKATPINIPMNNPETPALWIWLTTIILSLAVTVVYVKKRKRNTEINS